MVHLGIGFLDTRMPLSLHVLDNYKCIGYAKYLLTELNTMSRIDLLAASLVIAMSLSACGEEATAQTSQGSISGNPSPTQLAGISQFGEDADGNGVPDRLDAYVANMVGGPETKAAATSYFKLISMLSAKALAGQSLTNVEKVKVFKSLRCYSLSLDSEGSIRVGLDSKFMENKRAFDGMYALMAAMNGTLSENTADKEQMCAQAN